MQQKLKRFSHAGVGASVLTASLVVATMLMAPVHAAEAPAAFALCQSCHLEQAQGNPAVHAPALAGHEASYLTRQLSHFKTGLRPTDDAIAAPMKAVADGLSDSDMQTLSGYIASLPRQPRTPSTPDAAVKDKGYRIYIGSCGACHGGKAEGIAALNAPALYQDAAYLKRQLALFRSGKRGFDKTDKPGRQMARMALTLASDADIDAVLAYIGTLQP